MDALGRRLLEKLLSQGNRTEAGARSRQPSLTASQLVSYRSLPTLQKKLSCEATFLAAKSVGAIEIIRDRDNPEDGFIERINLLDVMALAAFLGEIPLSDQVAAASASLSGMVGEFPVLAEVLSKWGRAGRVRTLGPDSAGDWLDAIAVIHFARARATTDVVALPIREASAKLFRDSKRIERLVPQLDVILSGTIDSPPRLASEVLQEIGLFREEQPVLLAGNVVVDRGRVIAVLDAPYAGFSAAAVSSLVGNPDIVMSIENLTTFHSEAKRRCYEPILLLYTGGMPSPAWRQMYRRLLAGIAIGTPVYHWGDVDEGGFRIASVVAAEALASGHSLLPWKMQPSDVPETQRVEASEGTISRMQRFAQRAGWDDLAISIGDSNFTVEQEGL